MELADREFHERRIDLRRTLLSSSLLTGGKAVESFSALTANQFPEVTIKETGEKIQTKSPDELLMHGTLADGGLFSIHIEGGKLSGSGVQIDITGDAGDIKITNTSAFGGVDEDFIVTGGKGDSSGAMYGTARPLENLPIPSRSTSGSHGPAYKQA